MTHGQVATRPARSFPLCSGAGTRPWPLSRRSDPDARETLRAVSLDCAVMERAGNLGTVPLPDGWPEPGDWNPVWQSATRRAWRCKAPPSRSTAPTRCCVRNPTG
jgi:mannose-1-phosphate guanylyltransferase